MFFEFFQRILPKTFLNNSFPIASGVYRAMGRQFDDLKAAILEAQDQLFIDSATYMLPVYEAEFSIEFTDPRDIQGRRNNVMAMSRGGLGSTPQAIKNILKSYGYETKIIEDFSNYKVTIQFIDNRGIPSNLSDLQLLMYKMIPGHLQLNWSFIYTQYREVAPFTHQQMMGYTHNYLRTQLPS